MATEKLVVDNKLKTANSNIKIVQRKHEIPVKPYSGRLTRSMTSGVYVKKTSQRAGSGASRRQTQECVAKMLGLQSVPPSAPIATTSRDDAAMSMTKGAYVREVSQSRGSGASKPEIQRVGEILSLFKIVAVPTKSILDEEQATLIAASLQHDSIVDNDKPITSYEKTRLLNDRANHPVIECQCKVQVHKHLPSLEPSFAISLKSIIGSAAELGGDMKGGNLTNCGVELLN